MTNRLTPEDWIAAGFRALAKLGPEAVKAEALARDLGTTKGSFYWHFKNVPSFHDAMLALWQERAVADIIDAVEQVEGAANRLRALAKLAADPAPDRFGGRAVEPALRAWALRDPKIAAGVATVDAKRTAYLERLLNDAGKDPNHASLIYAAYVGFDSLGTEGRLAELIDLILRAQPA